MFRRTALFVIALACCGASIAAQSAIDSSYSRAYQESAPAASRATHHPRIDVAAGMTSVNLRKLPADSDVGGYPAGFFASGAFFWTRYLVTQVEIVSQAEKWNPDYALEYVVRPAGGERFELKTVILKHNYSAGRRTVAQIVQIGRELFIRPYFGAGVGIETQTIRDSRQESSRVLQPGEIGPPNAKTVDELPTEFPSPQGTDDAIVFAQAGAKVFAGRRAYFLVDWKFSNADTALIRLGFGVELF